MSGGPDLSLIRIPTVHVGRFDAHKVSYNLMKHLPSALEEEVQLRAGLWAIVGAPAERTKLVSEGGTVVQDVAFGAIDQVHNREGFDYLDLGVDRLRRTAAPASFGGVSGGGLWQVFIGTSESNEFVWTGNKRLEGVAFYQSSQVDGRQVVRCHGPRSLYHHGRQALHAA